MLTLWVAPSQTPDHVILFHPHIIIFLTIFYYLFSEACVLCFLRFCPLSSICKHPCPVFFTIVIALMTKALQQLRVTQPCSIVELCSGKLITLEQLFKTVPQEVSDY